MKSISLFILLLSPLLLTGCTEAHKANAPSLLPNPARVQSSTSVIKLPEPAFQGSVSLEETLQKRRSIRLYNNQSLNLTEISQLLWAAQGVTGEEGGRTAPSAGALYPLEVYLIAGNVENLNPGIYKYKPEGHELLMISEGDFRAELSDAALRQDPVKIAPVDIVITGVYERTTVKYGERGITFVHLEAGHAAQNICLQATALNLGSVTIGAFSDIQVKSVLSIPQNESPLYIIPVGRKL